MSRTRRIAKPWISCGIALFGLAAGPGATAQTANLAGASCAQLMELPPSDRGQMIVWLHGYYAGAAQRALLDRDQLQAAVDAIQKACAATPTLPLIGAEARAIFLGMPAAGPSGQHLEVPSAPPAAEPKPPAAPGVPRPVR